MKFFEAVPGELFSPLASPNRALYADALDVLYTAYRENLKIREDTLYSMLRSRLEQQLADATFEGEDIDEEELRDISGRARFLIRKLCGMDPELMEGDVGLFARPFQDKYGQLIEKLFSQITTADDTQLNARKQSELQENIQRYTDFRTYLKFDLETTDQNGTKQLLSQTLNTKSGGETQTPFYIAVLASFAQLYRVNDTSSFGNTVRLAVFDEAFNKMDSDRIIESVRLLRRMGLQAIICTPPDKVSDIMPIADRTLLVNKDKYRMHILPFGKEIVQ